jgi:pyridoxine 5-phosphate synthase
MKMRRLTVSLDALPELRDATSNTELDVAAAAMLAELAGVDAVRLGVNDDLGPVCEDDLREVRRVVRRFELRMPPSQALLKVALETRPDRVLLATEGPLDLRVRAVPLAPVIRALDEADIPVWAVVSPDLESVKIAHAEGVSGVEFYTGGIVDLPGAERASAFVGLGDSVRLASKLRLGVGLGGALGFGTVRDALDAAPATEWVAVGRAAVARALLVGLDRALRDLRALLA